MYVYVREDIRPEEEEEEEGRRVVSQIGSLIKEIRLE
jgi:hypothetical protein